MVNLARNFQDWPVWILGEGQYLIKYGLPAVELAEDCPALAYVAATSRCNEFALSRNQEGLEPKKKRAEILHLAGYPSEKWVVKLFKKIPIFLCNDSFFQDLNALLQSGDKDKFQILKHLMEVSLFSIKILSDNHFFPLFHPSFFDEIPMLKEDDNATDEFCQLYDLKEELFNLKLQGLRIPLLRSIDDLYGVHDLYIEQMEHQSYLDETKDKIFPPPPFPELEIKAPRTSKRHGIFPITTGPDLWEEGKRMHHCIAGHANRICESDGQIYAYHVELPDDDPATFTTENAGGSWEISEIRGPCNADVSSQTSSFVMEWLNRQTDKSEKADVLCLFSD